MQMGSGTRPRRCQTCTVLLAVGLLAALFCAPAGGTAPAVQQREIEALYYLATNKSAELGPTPVFAPLPRVHLIRIPKASSSSLSAVARRMAGCTPAGPCCKYPGSPAGSCPAPAANPTLLSKCHLDKTVIGCIDHWPHIEHLVDAAAATQIPTISMMREPISRSLSAYFYTSATHNGRRGRCAQNALTFGCFKGYAHSREFSNIVVKMLTGDYPYTKRDTCRKGCPHSLKKAMDNLDKTSVMGITEMWALSILVIYAKFPQFEPKMDEFDPKRMAAMGNRGGALDHRGQAHGSADNVTATSTQSEAGVEPQSLGAKHAFAKAVLKRYKSELGMQNQLDIELYKRALARLCRQLHKEGLWDETPVRKYWYANLPSGYDDAAVDCRGR